MVTATQSYANSYAELEALADLEEQAYVEERTRLLQDHPTGWDVNEACAISWETGLAAFVLNMRLSAPKEFEAWDNLKLSGPDILGRTFFKSRVTPRPGLDTGLAFLMEKAWKSSDPMIVRHVWKEIDSYVGNGGWLPEAPFSLWNALWESMPDEPWREVILYGVSLHDNEVAREVVTNILQGDGAKKGDLGVVFQGLYSAKPSYATEVVLSVFPRCSQGKGRLFYRAARILAEAPEPEARTALHEVALDGSKHVSFRESALEACVAAPRSEDMPVLRACLTIGKKAKTKNRVKRLRMHAIELLRHYQYEDAAPLLRTLLRPEEPPKVIVATLQSLKKLYAGESIVDKQDVKTDVDILAALADETGLSDATRRYVADMCSKLNHKLDTMP